MPTPDPDVELAQILAYAQASAAYITQQNALIAQLQAAQSGRDTDSEDVETAIQNILAFQAANPVPAAPVSVVPAPTPTPSPAPTPAPGS